MANTTKRGAGKARGGTVACAIVSHLSLYDGHRPIGTITGSKQGGFKAKPVHGASLGTFATIKAAADSLSAAGAVR